MIRHIRSIVALLFSCLLLSLFLTACGTSSSAGSYNSSGNSSNSNGGSYNNGYSGGSTTGSGYSNDNSVGPLPQPNGPVNSDPCSFAYDSSTEQNCRIENTDGSNPYGYGSGSDTSSSDGTSDSGDSGGDGN